MTTAQMRLYRAEWAKCRAALTSVGSRTAQEAEAERYLIHARCAGARCSSKRLNNSQLTQVLMVFWSWSQAANLELQLRADTEPARLGQFACRSICESIMDIDSKENIQPDKIDKYIIGIFHKLNPDAMDPYYATHEQWHKVMLACCYRYDQVMRRRLGIAHRNGRRWWPYNHQKNLALLHS